MRKGQCTEGTPYLWSAACAGDVFYVIEEGTFTIFDNSGQELARVGKGSCFGELALLREVLRARSCHRPCRHAGRTEHTHTAPANACMSREPPETLPCAGCEGCQREGGDGRGAAGPAPGGL